MQPAPDPQSHARFGTTRWSVILRAGSDDADATQRGLQELFDAYWYPLYAFCRRRGNSHHDALDLTQGFFAHLLHGNALEAISPEKGRFRSFLIASFKNFMANHHRATAAQRRGGGVAIVSLAATDFSARYEREPFHEETPDVLFDRSWVESLLTRVLQRLSEEYRHAGKERLFELLEPHLLEHADAIPRTEVSRLLQLSSAAVAMSIHRMRRRYGELLREEVAATVDDRADIEDELASLLSIVSRGG